MLFLVLLKVLKAVGAKDISDFFRPVMLISVSILCGKGTKIPFVDKEY